MEPSERKNKSTHPINTKLYAHLDFKSYVSRKKEMAENIKGRKCDGKVEEVAKFYTQLTKHKKELDDLLHLRRSMSNVRKKNLQGGQLPTKEDLRQPLDVGADESELKIKIKEKREEVDSLRDRMGEAALSLPNWTHPSVSVGDYDSSARVCSHFGVRPETRFCLPFFKSRILF